MVVPSAIRCVSGSSLPSPDADDRRIVALRRQDARHSSLGIGPQVAPSAPGGRARPALSSLSAERETVRPVRVGSTPGNESSPGIPNPPREMKTEMSAYDLTSPTLHAILDAAQDFGLAKEEVWRTIDETLMRAVDSDARFSGSVDELVAALAGRILAKERQALARRRGRAADELEP
jgi:hypothetical protein